MAEMTSRKHATRHDEVPEADALEQATPLVVEPDTDATDPPILHLPADVPEADALDQALPASDPDDDWREQDR